MTMLELFKTRLPEGLEIVKVQDRASASQVKIWFSYDGTEGFTTLQKTCAPGMAEKNCDFSICVAMLGIALDRNDREMIITWRDKQRALCEPLI